ncbi:MAG: hypothetical protein H6822_05450 [Planctomycetaceae bacterium]|nr:hypothetical protein [Planctomycetales bacterium]MCB9921603.1 hypothetical protein [Planctomycetaceae bacterium]
MTCVHLKKLYKFCQEENVKIGGTDLVRIVCEQCGVQDECPSMLMEQLEAKEAKTTQDTAPLATPDK